MIKVGTIVKIKSVIDQVPHPKEYYDTCKNEKCFPLADLLPVHYFQGEIGEVVVSFNEFAHIYLVNVVTNKADFTKACIVIFENGIEPIFDSNGDFQKVADYIYASKAPSEDTIISGLTETQKEEIRQSIEKLKRSNKVKKWKPGILGEKYFYVSTFGIVADKPYCGSVADGEIIKTGRYAKTEEECQAIIERDYVTEELLCYAAEHNTCEVDRADSHQFKYFIALIVESKELYTMSCACFLRVPSSTALFSSTEIARDAIKAVGEDRIRKYYFGIGDKK